MNQREAFPSTVSGVPKKNGGSTPVRVSTCQTQKSAASSSTRPTSSRSVPLALCISREDLRLEQFPDLAVQLEEPGRQAHFRHVARPGEIDGELADGARLRT